MPRLLIYGVPQGSVLELLLFTLYFVPIASIVRWHGLIAHLNADDTQLYIVFDQNDAAETIKQIKACVMEITSWMAMDWLRLNDEKDSFVAVTDTTARLLLVETTSLHLPQLATLVPFLMNI